MTNEEAIENLKLVRLNAAVTGAALFKKAIDLAIVALSQPSLPSNIDEAAEEYGIDIRLGYPRVMDETDRYIYNAFKAGAEWMARQGQTFAAHFDDGYGCAVASGVKLSFVLWNTYEDGDVLKVQIRKK